MSVIAFHEKAGRSQEISFRRVATVAMLPSALSRSDSFARWYQLSRSPKSNPMVNLCWQIFLLCSVLTVLTFFIAGLLFICALSTSITWERTPHPVRRPAFSSHLNYNSYRCPPQKEKPPETERDFCA